MTVGTLLTTDNNPWEGRRVLVTGAAGFVGSWLVEALVRRGSEVFACVLPERAACFSADKSKMRRVHVIPGRVDNYHFVEHTIRSYGIDSVFHLAAVNVNFKAACSPLPLLETNIRGVYNVLEAARVSDSVRRIVIASSREAEDSQRAGGEAVSVRLRRHPYQVSKMGAELIAQAYHDTFGAPVVIARCDNIYGGRDFNWNRLVPGTIKLVLSGRPPLIRSDGMLERNYVYVEDIIKAYLLVCDKAGNEGVSGEIFHFGTDARVSVLDVVEKITRLAGRPELKPVVLNESKDERIDEVRSFERERQMLEWTSEVDMERGLGLTLHWYKSYFEKEGFPLGNILR